MVPHHIIGIIGLQHPRWSYGPTVHPQETSDVLFRFTQSSGTMNHRLRLVYTQYMYMYIIYIYLFIYYIIYIHIYLFYI
jgi:hypothetical protein